MFLLLLLVSSLSAPITAAAAAAQSRMLEIYRRESSLTAASVKLARKPSCKMGDCAACVCQAVSGLL